MTEIKRSEAKAILRNYHALVERQYKGDVDAIVTLVDLDVAIKLAKLTARQAEALRLVYVEDLTQKSAGERLDVSREAVSLITEFAITKIQAVYDKWAEVYE